MCYNYISRNTQGVSPVFALVIGILMAVAAVILSLLFPGFMPKLSMILHTA